ncbi:MAG: NADH-dependent [FeFe] hydrogenase, group A6 [Oscillospiraceae bacterium]|nr:NADH-dependent [FeFe] hydrogenase, group A6 [Oscillospiraceae bacterium]
MENINVKINGVNFEVPKTSTVMDACRVAGIDIPTLCYMKDVNAIGSCRVCVVEVKGARTLVASCVYPVADGMEISTNSQKVIESRKTTLELILSNHRMDCLTCLRNQNCELQKMAKDFGIQDIRFECDNDVPRIEDSEQHLVRDNSKCIICRRCVSICKNNQAVAVIGPNNRGFDTQISCAYDRNLDEVPCVSCGQCIAACPTAALTEKDHTEQVWQALDDPSKHVVIAAAPSIRVTLGECFGMPIGTNVEGKMVAAMRRLGFDGVFDLNTAADLTVMEEGPELLSRLNNGGKLPMTTSCCPGWIRYCEQFYPEFIPHVSSCKSPQQMYGAIMKTYYAKKMDIDPKDIYVVSVIPCTAKKFEVTRDGQSAVEGLHDIDAALTTRELARMISRAGIMFSELPDEGLDPAFGVYSGAGGIFGTTGGVMEAALRTVSELATGKPAPSIDFTDVRGLEGIKEASYTLGDREVKVAVASGLVNVRRLLDKIKAGEVHYDFIEMMACSGGCINGGGQPVQAAPLHKYNNLRALRSKPLYDQDKAMTLRKAHENPVIKEIYQEIGEPGGHTAHEWLHTTYTPRAKYKTD